MIVLFILIIIIICLLFLKKKYTLPVDAFGRILVPSFGHPRLNYPAIPTCTRC